MNDTEYEIPPYLRKNAKTPKEHARWYLEATDGRIAWLKERGLRPHVTVLESRKHCADFLEGKVPELDIKKFLAYRIY